MLSLVHLVDQIVNNFFVHLVEKYSFLWEFFYNITFFGSFEFTLGFSIVLVSILLILFLLTNNNKYFKSLSVFLTTILILNYVIYNLKIFVDRAGPIGRAMLETDPSFPSGHSASAVFIFGIIYFLFRDKLRSKKHKQLFLFLTILIILLVGFSRLVLNVHFLSDVLVGYFFGGLFLYFGYLFLHFMLD